MAKIKPLVIVESPAKIKTISRILGDKYKVVSSMGHLIDLPKSTLGVDVDNDFMPRFIVLRNKQKILTKLKKEAENKKEIYFATDPDREGEAIGWNLIPYIGEGKKVYRVTFQEITKEAVLKAFKNPREFNKHLIKAQVARRILDRIVGYKISPLLWKKVGSRLSAGRVQSVALRLIVDRERAILAFIPQEYWEVALDLRKPGLETILTAALERVDGEKPGLSNQAQVDEMVKEIRAVNFQVSRVTKKNITRKSAPPYITSTLQQDAFNKLGFSAMRTMTIAQELYEGIEVGESEPVGLITYMRTDSVNISKDAMGKVRDFISSSYGKSYLPEEPNVFKSKKSAQEAHEAIRPSSVSRKPEDIRSFLEEDQFKLYDLIWKRFVSSQMSLSVYENKKIEIQGGRFQLGASGSSLIFDGYLLLQQEQREEEVKMDFTPYHQGDALETLEVKPSQHFTKPPPRFSDASLVKALEEEGIGRPSTYASIIQTLVFRNYVNRERGYFRATELGMQISDLLVEYFSRIMDVKFTAGMEERLDQIEEGNLEHVVLLRDFYEPFKKELNHAMETIEKAQNFVDKHCPECGQQMVVKWGRRGKFLSCSGFPKCKYAQPFTSGIPCPVEGCSGELIKRRSRRGQTFYGCSNYPECTFTDSKLPEKASGS
ncbi:MAG TPA: type I DNA topoisomerase [Candidatus Omnitrophota bacterium]|nr:type I DNA topoisomerase [Candidatus Omnitrophota bacterium]HPN56355.1 type I DNA topoisomerase [Candidatus Omnitrophota bacterium]